MLPVAILSLRKQLGLLESTQRSYRGELAGVVLALNSFWKAMVCVDCQAVVSGVLKILSEGQQASFCDHNDLWDVKGHIFARPPDAISQIAPCCSSARGPISEVDCPLEQCGRFGSQSLFEAVSDLSKGQTVIIYIYISKSKGAAVQKIVD